MADIYSPSYPRFLDDRCTGCGYCVQLCPTRALEKVYGEPYLARPGHCLSCGLCSLLCPEHALVMEIDDFTLSDSCQDLEEQKAN